MRPVVEVLVRITMDEAKLDEYVRGLFEEPDDPVPGEPRPGLQLAYDWAKEEQEKAAEGHGLDMMWAQGSYVDSLTFEVTELTA
jgi:hypothetical protein